MKLEIKSSDKVEDKKKLSKKQKLKNIEANTENTENNMKIRKLSNNSNHNSSNDINNLTPPPLLQIINTTVTTTTTTTNNNNNNNNINESHSPKLLKDSMKESIKLNSDNTLKSKKKTNTDESDNNKNKKKNNDNDENILKSNEIKKSAKPQDIKITMLKIELQKNNEKLIQNQPKIKSMTNNFKKNINVIDKTINDNNAVDGEEDKLNSNEQNKEILQNSKNEIIGKKPQKRKKSKSDIMEENSKYFSKRIKVAINNKDNSNKLMQDFYRINNNISNKNNNNKSSDKAELIYNNVKNNESCQNTQNSNPIETTDSNNNNNNKLSKSSDTDLNNNNGEYKKKKKENDNDKSNKAIKRKLEAKGLDLRESKKRIIESSKLIK